MVRFSCFNAHIHSNKPKKTIEPSAGAMHSKLKARVASTKAPNIKSSSLKAQADTGISSSNKNATGSVSIERGWKSQEINGKLRENDTRVQEKCLLKKSQSLGSELCRGRRVLCENDTEDENVFSSDSLDQIELLGPDGTEDPGVNTVSQQENVPRSESVRVGSDLVNKKSIFSIEDPQHSQKEGNENSESLFFGDGIDESGNHMPRTPQMIVRSYSLPNISPSSPTSSRSYGRLHSRSSEDLHVLCMRWKEVSFSQVGKQVICKPERRDNISKPEIFNFENSLDNGNDSYNYSALANDWIIPGTDEVNLATSLQGGSSICQRDESLSKDFKFKRIEEWVNDLQHCSPVQETNEIIDTGLQLNGDSNIINGSTATKADAKVTPGMEAAKKYISSLSASASTAQLSNHGLAVIPFLSAFVSLRILNLSGNSIVRITAGALPRGLHVLNLSKNSISTIEGLRELTRLRVLDLSYNRIFRIGHGLASCSSLKELYLAGNKISEVEGLHRLLKLTVLDLRFNKISTSKCLGQLAANYNSLQAISLEGNPAQKNVGDEQLKKYLQGLLPHLVYFNRQPTKVSTLKDAADRSVRLGINSQKFERGLRSDNKAARKASHGLANTRPISSSTNGRKGQAVASPKMQKSKDARLPPIGNKTTTNNRHNDVSGKLPSFRSDFSIRRSRSEGMLGAL
ncbi:hypothetical protein JCGZ_19754 [Jatropha curcas]|uniref:Protein phosphatase 1 regulatory subunit pprA n=1 Tax=Jatropha curcas TaxID=180498 RepID=A0A067L869_JATCU|nr:uncharacterized protein LOC105650208 [Jatropha curcas]KDP44612.1 hypothetical protein JCGZ_19754 [Jatropha curcas]